MAFGIEDIRGSESGVGLSGGRGEDEEELASENEEELEAEEQQHLGEDSNLARLQWEGLGVRRSVLAREDEGLRTTSRP